jgi:hypothetical protein
MLPQAQRLRIGGGMQHDLIDYVVLWTIVSVVVVGAIVGGSQWLRDHREREIYRQTQKRKP